jgi:hypothetical protein
MQQRKVSRSQLAALRLAGKPAQQDTAYTTGFAKTCASKGVDPVKLAKLAGLLELRL